ncbi:hypothetical protein EMIT0232MI5_40306 [Pseudomonas sp. IT-232MI5]
MHSNVGAAEGCDLLLYAVVALSAQSDNVRLSIAAGMLGPHLHGRLL